MTTKETIEYYERRAKKLDVLALVKDDSHVKEIYRKQAEKCKRTAAAIKELYGRSYHTVARNYDGLE